MRKFVGRERELRELGKEKIAKHASLIVLSWRRRIGKTSPAMRTCAALPYYGTPTY